MCTRPRRLLLTPDIWRMCLWWSLVLLSLYCWHQGEHASVKPLQYLTLSVSWLGLNSQSFLGSLQCLVLQLIKISYLRITQNKMESQLLLLRTPVDVSFNRSRMAESPSLNLCRSMLTSYRRNHAVLSMMALWEGKSRWPFKATTAIFFLIIAFSI